MAEDKHQSLHRLGRSTNVTIGKKTYSQEDLDRFTGPQGIRHNAAVTDLVHNTQARPQTEQSLRTAAPTGSHASGAGAPSTGTVQAHASRNVETGSRAAEAAQASVIRQTQHRAGSTNLMTGSQQAGRLAQDSLLRYHNSGDGRIKTADTAPQTAGWSAGAALAGRQLVNGAKGALGGGDDLGVQTARGTIEAGVGAYTGFRAVQSATPAILNAPETIVKRAEGVWDVATTAGRATVTVARTAGFLQAAKIVPLNTAAVQVLKSQAAATRLNQTMLSRAVIHRVKEVQAGARRIKTGVVTTFGSKEGLKAGAKKLGKTAFFAPGEGARWAIKHSPQAARMVSRGAVGVSGVLSRQEDMAVQGTGHAIGMTRTGLKTGVSGVRATSGMVKTSVKTTAKAGKATWHAAAYIKNRGLRAAWDRARTKSIQMTAQAGRSVVSAVIQLVRAAGTKVMVPLLLIAVVAMAATGVITTPVMAISSIFGSVFSTSDNDTDYEVRDYIMDANSGIPAMREAYIVGLVAHMEDSLEAAGGDYHYVRLYTNLSDDVIEVSYDGVSSVFYTAEDLGNIIQPLFNAVILMDYDLEPTEREAQTLLQEMFDTLFILDEASTVEWCGQSATDGLGEPSRHDCGEIHAHGDCPNPIEGRHGTFTCRNCCVVTEEGFYCRGYINCGGHEVLSITLNMDGIYELLAKYFNDPINQLSNLATRTEEQEEKLENLKDYLDICEEYIRLVAVEYGGGLTMADLSGVVWVNGSRIGNQSVIDLALSQVGQAGGQPYWSFCHFSSRVEWCGCFVHWVMVQSGNRSLYATSANNNYVPTLVSWFRSNGRWADSNFRDLVPGDTIFFDWKPGTGPDHIGLVIGRDDTYVYTVEGNSGDAVKMKQYRLDSAVIYGYGLMNY